MVEGLRWVSLQKFHGLDQLDAAVEPVSRIEDLGARIDLGPDAFLDTAAVMAASDLVITSDTSTAHLAGALGRPTWVVLSRPADWRWGHLPDQTPWYPNMRLYRQPSPGDWRGVFTAVAKDLRDWIESGSIRAVECT
jgi:ADP-heptose:LPS heptosyltransferase